MALKLNGKDDELRRRDFRALASTAGISAAQADCWSLRFAAGNQLSWW
jgi:hypothetical protein